MSPPPSVSAASSRTEKEKEAVQPSDGGRGWRFWIIFLALCLALFLTALDLASVSTALPSIIHDLNGTDSFVWVSSAYNLALLLVSILIFGAGSAVTAAAQSMNMLIAGRTIQGVGSGAIQVLVAIVTADLIPLKDRGFFQALTGASYINLPLCGIAFAVCLVFLRLRKPPIESYSKAFFAIDWIGNAIIIGSATSCILALTWAGIQFPWSSPQVIAPLVIGLLGFAAALLYDRYYASHPVVPAIIINNRTSLGGYIASFLHGLVVNSVACKPTYFQAAKIATPLLSGLYLFPSAITISPSAIAQGIIISKTGKYRVIQVIGWCAMLLGVGLLQLLDENTPIAISIPFQIIAAVGFGFLYATTFTVLAPLEPTQNAAALSFLLFVRTLSSAWAISISATILQNQLRTRLPPAFLARLPPGGHDIAYSAIPIIPTLPQPLQGEVRAAFADSIRLIWHVLIAFAGAGLLSVLFQRDVALHSKMDKRWGMKEAKKDGAGAVEEGEEGAMAEKKVDVAEGQLGGALQVLPGDALQSESQRD
ncbi:major facilitator superfamily domain-containing protein [Cerioporus squamosus]|nr:major facilitator superfamily domain-containing protein [Cerioporus squamosus]